MPATPTSAAVADALAGIDYADDEGRVITAEFGGCVLVNVYVPNSGMGLERLQLRTGFTTATGVPAADVTAASSDTGTQDAPVTPVSPADGAGAGVAAVPAASSPARTRPKGVLCWDAALRSHLARLRNLAAANAAAEGRATPKPVILVQCVVE
jgi:hypothetical protein